MKACSEWNLTTSRADELGVITDSVMLKDETRCISLRALRGTLYTCGTITAMESFDLVSADPTWAFISIESIDRSFRSNPAPAGALKR